MSKWDKKFSLGGQTEIDVVAMLDGKIKVKSMSLSEAQAIQRKPSKWRIQLFQQGYHSYKSNME